MKRLKQVQQEENDRDFANAIDGDSLHNESNITKWGKYLCQPLTRLKKAHRGSQRLSRLTLKSAITKTLKFLGWLLVLVVFIWVTATLGGAPREQSVAEKEMFIRQCLHDLSEDGYTIKK